MSSSMLSLLAGLGNGYLKGTQKRQDDERQAKLDNQNTQLFDARMADINRANTDRQALSDAAKPATANENAVTLNTGDGPRVYEMPKGVDATDVAASDARQFTRSLNQAPARDCNSSRLGFLPVTSNWPSLTICANKPCSTTRPRSPKS